MEANLLPIIVGVLFVFISIKLLKSLILEVVWLGAVLGGIEVWHYQATAILGWTPLPDFILVAGASAMVTWVILRLIYVLSLLPTPLQPLFATVTKLVNGGI